MRLFNKILDKFLLRMVLWAFDRGVIETYAVTFGGWEVKRTNNKGAKNGTV